MLRKTALGRRFLTLVTSSGLSNLADGIYKMALPLAAAGFTRSPAVIAGIELVRTLPWLLGALPIGALTDRIDRKKSMISANTARLAVTALAAIGIALGGPPIVLLYLAALGTGWAEVFYDTAAQSIMPSLVDHSQLERANGRLIAVERGSQEFLGPPLGGLLVATALPLFLGASAVLWALAIVALSLLRGSYRPATTQSEKRRLRSDIGRGLKFIRSEPLLWKMAVMVGVNNLATSATFPLLVLYAVGSESTLRLSEPEYGFLFTLVSIGGVTAGLAGGFLERRLGRSRTLTMSLIGSILFVAMPAFTDSAAVIAVTFLVGGFTVMSWNVITVSFRQRITPDDLLGRVNSTYRLLAWGTIPVGSAIGGALGEWLGIRPVFAVMGFVLLWLFVPNRHLTDEALAAA